MKQKTKDDLKELVIGNTVILVIGVSYFMISNNIDIFTLGCSE